MTAARRILANHGRARHPAALLDSMRQLEHGVDRLAAALRSWARRRYAGEIRAAVEDLPAYLSHRHVVKQQEPPSWVDPADWDLSRILMAFGLRRAAGAAQASGFSISPALLADAVAGKPVKIVVFQEIQRQALQSAIQISRETRSRIRGEVNEIMRDGVNRGLTTGEITRRIAMDLRVTEVDPENPDQSKTYAFSWARAELIARTELVQAENTGRMAGFAATGVDELEWLAYSDGRSGDRHHEKLDGVRFRRGDTVLTPLGNRVRYPGDPLAPIEETANCRCTVVPVRRER